MNNAAMMGAIGSGLGLLRGMGQEKQWERQRQVEALKTAYAPILGTMGDMGQRPDKFQSALDFGVKGMSLGMAMDKHNKSMTEGKPSGDANAAGAVKGDVSTSPVFAPGNMEGMAEFGIQTADPRYSGTSSGLNFGQLANSLLPSARLFTLWKSII